MNKQQYQEYLRSDHWRDIRESKLTTAGYKCEKCGKDAIDANLEVHHLTYDRIGKERFGDLQVLCRNCHKATHDNGFIPIKTISDDEVDRKTAADIMGLLGMTFDEALAYTKSSGK